jgi:hypothetical protein
MLKRQKRSRSGLSRNGAFPVTFVNLFFTVVNRREKPSFPAPCKKPGDAA